MKAMCEIAVSPAATSQQLKYLAEALERWCDEILDSEGPLCRVDPQQLQDLQAGELPKPEFLQWTAHFREMNRVMRFIGEDAPELEPYQREQLKLDLGEAARARSVVIYIDYDPETGYRNAIEMIKVVVPEHPVEKLDVVEIPDDEMPDSYE